MELEKKRILFVDDEPAILDGLKDSLRRYRKQWDMVFEQYPKRAVEFLRDTPVDVVVSDMRMPEMDGATLLNHVRDQYPATVRIILSGFTELEVAIRAVSVAHQFLTKPCEPTHLEHIVERACKMQGILQSEELRQIIGKMESLPTTPQIYADVTHAMSSPTATAPSVAKIIEQDPAMCAKLLQMSNSGFFRLSRPISRVEDAIVYLGFNMIKNLVLSTEVFSKTLVEKKQRAAQRDIQQHSHLTALLALHIASDKQTKEDAFLAAILHDVGKLVLTSEREDYPQRVLAHIEQTGVDYAQAERELYGVSHAKVGAYLLGLWGVPFNVVEAVAYHHRAEYFLPPQEGRGLDAVTTVAFADALAREALPSRKFPANDNHAVENMAEQIGKARELKQLRTDAAQSVKLARAS